MAKFDWEAHPVVEEVPVSETPTFDWEKYSPVDDRQVAGEEVKPSQPEISAARAALVGAGSGATGGFAEEATAPIMAAALMTKGAFGEGSPTLPGETTLSKFKRLMQEYRDVAREEQKIAQEQQPLAYGAGAVGGGILTTPLLPGIKAASTAGKIAAGAAEGAGLGAIYGAGETEGGLKERVEGAKEMAKTGGLIGAAVPGGVAAVKGAGKAFKAAGEIPIIADIGQNIKEGLKGQSLITGKARRELAEQGREAGEAFYQDIKTLQNQVGEEIGAKIEAAQEAGAKVDLTAEVNGVLKSLDDIKREGSKEAASYASGVESEIRKVLKLPKAKVAEEVVEAGPEGIIPEAMAPKAAEEVQQILVDPKRAQDLKQVLSEYTPRKGMRPQEVAPAKEAKQLRGAAEEQLTSMAGLEEVNKHYGFIKDSLKRIGVNERRLPTQIKAKISQVVTKLEKENVSGDQARFMVEDVLNNIREVSPEIAAKHEKNLFEIARKLDLAEKNIRGSQTQGLLGTTRAAVTSAANLAGLAAGKVPGVTPTVKGVEAAKNFTQTMLKSPKIAKGMEAVERGAKVGGVEAPESLAAVRSATEPHIIQRQVAQAAESAEPETLRDQASQIRQKYGNQGEQLATILENMADKDKSARRALMFSILQNQAYRKMLGLQEGKE